MQTAEKKKKKKDWQIKTGKKNQGNYPSGSLISTKKLKNDSIAYIYSLELSKFVLGRIFLKNVIFLYFYLRIK